jgi:hypothetical protein
LILSALFLRTLGPLPLLCLAPRLVRRLDPEAAEPVLEGLRCLFRFEAKDDVLGLTAPYAVLPPGLVHGTVECLQLTIEGETLSTVLAVQQDGHVERIESVQRGELKIASTTTHG